MKTERALKSRWSTACKSLKEVERIRRVQVFAEDGTPMLVKDEPVYQERKVKLMRRRGKANTPFRVWLRQRWLESKDARERTLIAGWFNNKGLKLPARA